MADAISIYGTSALFCMVLRNILDIEIDKVDSRWSCGMSVDAFRIRLMHTT